MSQQERAIRTLELIARSLNERGFRGTIRGTLGRQLERASVRLLDTVVERFAGGEINTLSDALDRRSNKAELPAVTPRYEPAFDRAKVAPPLRPSDTKGLNPLVETHGIDRLVLLPRSDREAFAYWEIDRRRLQTIEPEGAGPFAELRLVDLEDRVCISRVEVPKDQGRAYLDLPGKPGRYLAELVLVGHEEEVLLSRSRPM